MPLSNDGNVLRAERKDNFDGKTMFGLFPSISCINAILNYKFMNIRPGEVYIDRNEAIKSLSTTKSSFLTFARDLQVHTVLLSVLSMR